MSFKTAGLPYNEGVFVNDKPYAQQPVIDALKDVYGQGLKFTLTGGFGGGHVSPEHTKYGTGVDIVPQGGTGYDALVKALNKAGLKTLVHNAGSGMHIHATPGQDMLNRAIQAVTGEELPLVAKNTTTPVQKLAQTINTPIGAAAGTATPPPVLGQSFKKGMETPLKGQGQVKAIQTGGQQMDPLQRLAQTITGMGSTPQLGMNRGGMGGEMMPSPANNIMGMPRPSARQGGMTGQQQSPIGAAAPIGGQQKKKINLTPLSLALIGIGQNLMHPTGTGEFIPLANYKSNKDLQTQKDELTREIQAKQEQLSREKMQLEKDLQEKKIASDKEYKDRAMAISERELALKEQKLQSDIKKDTGLNITGKSSDSVLQMLNLKNDPEAWSSLTPDVQNQMDEYLNLKIKEAGKMFSSEFAGKKGSEMGKIEGQLSGDLTVGDVEATKAEGKQKAVVGEEYRMMKSKLPSLEKTVGELKDLSKKATYTKAGQYRNEALRQLGLPVPEGGVARAELVAKVNNQVLPLLRETFGAAFTVAEGESLRAALVDVNASPDEREAILNAFIEQKKRSIEDKNRQLQMYDNESMQNNDPLGLF